MLQDNTLRLVPGQKDKVASVSDTANSLGLHDTLEFGPRTISAQIKSSNDLRNRLENVSDTAKRVDVPEICSGRKLRTI